MGVIKMGQDAADRQMRKEQPLEEREGIDWSPDQDLGESDATGPGVPQPYQWTGDTIADAVSRSGQPPTDRGRHAGHALTEVRTVLSRAQTALQRLEDHSPLEYPPLTGNPVLDGYRTRSDGRFDDPDLDDMIQILKITVGMLKRWERTGKATRSTCL